MIKNFFVFYILNKTVIELEIIKFVCLVYKRKLLL